MDPSSPPAVAGLSLSGSEPYAISETENRELCASIGVAPASDGSAHPIFFYIATQVGMGKTVAGLCEACEFDVADGPMMGASRVRFSTPLMVNQPYMVEGEILSLTRKQSRKMGVMDVLEFELRLRIAGQAPAVANVNTWMLPRRNLQ